MKRLSLSLVLVALCLCAAAQIVNPVHWTSSVEMTSATEGVLHWTATMDKGWHMYDMTMPHHGDDVVLPPPTTFTFDSVPGVTYLGLVTPDRRAHEQLDKTFAAKIGWWEGKVSFSRRFRLKGVAGAVIKGNVKYMACNDSSCQPPATEAFDLTAGTPSGSTDETQTAEAVAIPEAAAEQSGMPLVTKGENKAWWKPVKAPKSDDASLPDQQPSAWWALLLWGFIGGLAALLTPCVWPMIPMTLSFFLKKGTSRAKSLRDALTYGLSIVVIFLVLGIAITVIFGAGKLNELATSAVFNIIFFLILVVFAISFFGAFDIKLPSRWSNSVDSKVDATSGVISIFLMAFTLVLVSFSCTGPIIGTLLVEAASQGNILGPAVGMGGFALGLAIPFSLFALFPQMMKSMPKSGGWLNTVKVTLGFLELILSLKFLSVADLAYGWHILDREVFLALWIVLFALLGMYLLGKLRLAHDDDSGGRTSVTRLFLAIASFAFAVYLIPGLWGAPLKSISAFAPPLSTQDFNLYGGEFKEFDNYDDGMAYAAECHKPVLIDFSGYACVNCRKMEGAVFDTPEVRTIIENDYVMIKLMVDDKKPLEHPYTEVENGKTITISTVGERWSYLQRHKFGTNSQPYYIVLDNAGQALTPPRVYDENVNAFVEWLQLGVNRYEAQKQTSNLAL